MALETPDLILTKSTYIDHILHSQNGQRFFYRRDDNFNIKYIEGVMKSDYNIIVKYDGSYDEPRRIYKLQVVDIPDQELPDEIVEQKTIFFDPQNLLQ
jgi:hypothetical protein